MPLDSDEDARLDAEWVQRRAVHQWIWDKRSMLFEGAVRCAMCGKRFERYDEFISWYYAADVRNWLEACPAIKVTK